LKPKEIETKLGAARTRLILEKPFIGALVMHLPLLARPWCSTTATDARALYYNPDYIAALSLAETQFVLAHEALHCALGHFARRQHRTRRRWDLACDHAVNLLLLEEGLKPPPGALANPAFRGLAAEEIYPLIPAQSGERTLDLHLFDEEPAAIGEEQGTRARAAAAALAPARAGGESAQRPPSGPGPGERDRLAERWRIRLVSAAQQARQAGRLGNSWLRRVDRLVQPRLSWRTLLARYLMALAREDYSFQRPSRREGEALLPGLASGALELHVVLDTSGSIGEEELAEFCAELDALKAQVRARIVLHACDERLDPRGPWTFEPWEPIERPPQLEGGGGTSFLPPFAWLEARGVRPDCLLYFTDAEGEFPPHPPVFPVLWLVKGTGRVPWGERIQLNA
jgi:predicted metal-dependent peptidase